MEYYKDDLYKYIDKNENYTKIIMPKTINEYNFYQKVRKELKIEDS